jgi:hypothetical protein
MEGTRIAREITAKTPSSALSTAYETPMVSDEKARTIVDVDRVDFQFDRTEKIFGAPGQKQTEDYISGRFG